jgi:hypothetical protein
MKEGAGRFVLILGTSANACETRTREQYAKKARKKAAKHLPARGFSTSFKERRKRPASAL